MNPRICKSNAFVSLKQSGGIQPFTLLFSLSSVSIRCKCLNERIPMADEILLRDVIAGDLSVLYEQQTDADAIRMAAFPSRDRDAFMAHWAKMMADDALTLKSIIFDGQVAGYISSWQQDGRRLVAFWIGKNFWGRKIASRALAEFLQIVSTRPLFAHVAIHNIASIRVLEKCGFTISSDETRSSTASDGVEEVVMKLDR